MRLPSGQNSDHAVPEHLVEGRNGKSLGRIAFHRAVGDTLDGVDCHGLAAVDTDVLALGDGIPAGAFLAVDELIFNDMKEGASGDDDVERSRNPGAVGPEAGGGTASGESLDGDDGGRGSGRREILVEVRI